jgi:hypothetical protein
VWLDHELHEIGPWTNETFPIEGGPLPSPDGSLIAIVLTDAEGLYDTWLSDVDRPVLRKWLEEPGRDCFPTAWLPDGTGCAYQSRTARETLHYLIRFDDPKPVLLLEDRETTGYYAVSSFADGGGTLLFTAFMEGQARIETLDVAAAEAGDRAPKTLLEHAANAVLSPDGQWLAYLSDQSGQWEVYVRRWRGHGALGEESRVSESGIASGPAGWWSSSRLYWLPARADRPQELWYRSDQDLFAVAVTGQDRFSRPRKVAEWPEDVFRAHPLPDGRWIASLTGKDEGPPRELRVIRGWRSELERSVR